MSVFYLYTRFSPSLEDTTSRPERYQSWGTCTLFNFQVEWLTVHGSVGSVLNPHASTYIQDAGSNPRRDNPFEDVTHPVLILFFILTQVIKGVSQSFKAFIFVALPFRFETALCISKSDSDMSVHTKTHMQTHTHTHTHTHTKERDTHTFPRSK